MGFVYNDERTASVLSLLQTIVGEIDRPGGVLESPAAVASVEQTLLTFMQFGLEHNLSDVLRVPEPAASDEQVRKVEEYIEAHAHEPINSETIGRFAVLYKKHFGEMPSETLDRVSGRG